MFWPCETRTSTCRNFATISSSVYRFFGIAVLLHVKRHSSGRTTSKGEDQSRTISKLQATTMQLATKAAGGDHAAIGRFLDWIDEIETRAASR